MGLNIAPCWTQGSTANHEFVRDAGIGSKTTLSSSFIHLQKCCQELDAFTSQISRTDHSELNLNKGVFPEFRKFWHHFTTSFTQTPDSENRSKLISQPDYFFFFLTLSITSSWFSMNLKTIRHSAILSATVIPVLENFLQTKNPWRVEKRDRLTWMTL